MNDEDGSGSNSHTPLDTGHITFRKSSYSDHKAICVEVGRDTDGSHLVRDSKDRSIPAQRYSLTAWRAFLDQIKNGKLD